MVFRRTGNSRIKCEKKAFDNIDDARLRLTEIVLKSKRDSKPIRVYKCEFCGKYHLTSKSDKQYKSNITKKRNHIAKKNKKREDSFIRREAEYWEKRFGIDD